MTFKDKDKDVDSAEDAEQINKDTITKTYYNNIIESSLSLIKER